MCSRSEFLFTALENKQERKVASNHLLLKLENSSVAPDFANVALQSRLIAVHEVVM